jgi:putative transposase
VKERLYLIDSEHILSTRKQCKILVVHRSGLYYKPKGEKSDNLEIMRIMDEHYLKHPTEGVIRMQDLLLSLCIVANHKRVRRLLRLMGLMAIYPKRNLSKLGSIKYIRPYLLKALKIERSNQVWAIDITYIPMKNGFLYLTAIIDLYSRFIVGLGISNTLDAEASLSVMKQAIKEHGKPEIINSDYNTPQNSDHWLS